MYTNIFAIFDGSRLRIHAIAIAADLKANHARTKCLEQHLGIGWIIAQISDNESVAVVRPINSSSALARGLPYSPSGSSANSFIPSKRGATGLLPPMIAVERSRLRPTSWAMIAGWKRAKSLHRPLNALGSNNHGIPPLTPTFETDSRWALVAQPPADEMPDQAARRGRGFASRGRTGPGEWTCLSTAWNAEIFAIENSSPSSRRSLLGTLVNSAA